MEALPPTRMRCRSCAAPTSRLELQYCEVCFGPLELLLEPDLSDPPRLRSLLRAGPPSIGRYAPLLPSELLLTGAHSGWTPLRPAPDLGAALGLDDLWLKDETRNPTGSFKDRVVDTAIGRGVATGARVVACSSTGNLARAVAHGAARRGLHSVLLVPQGLPSQRVAELVGLGARVLAVAGGYDAVNRLAAEAADELAGWAWVNVSLRPWYELGAMTLGWEVLEQLDWQAPERVVAPVASGALLCAAHRSMEMLLAGGVGCCASPRVTAVQAQGCAPVVQAFDQGRELVEPVRPSTIATSLAMGAPPDGTAVLEAVRSSRGVAASAAEDEILPAVELVRRCEGLLVDPAFGVVVAALSDLRRRGEVDPGERIVAVLTGGATSASQGSLVARLGSATSIEPSVGALVAALPPDLIPSRGDLLA